jgi:hypothetical protein
MITPIDQHSLFEVNRNYEFVSFEEGVLIIDNWYENIDEITNHLKNATVTMFKGYGPNGNSKNWVDFYDCKYYMQNVMGDDYPKSVYHEVIHLVRKYFLEGIKCGVSMHNGEILDFNYFKYIDGRNHSNTLDIHKDTDYAAVVFLDDTCDGGTAVYEENMVESKTKSMFDYHKEYDIEYEMKYLAKAKKNRLVMFSGRRPHGGFIEHTEKYTNDWRINQAFFIDTQI